MTKPAAPIAITPGEPAGIGPDLIIQLAQQKLACNPVVLADPELIKTRAEILGLPIQLEDFSRYHPEHKPGTLNLLPVKLAQPTHCGQLDVRNANYVLESLRQAIEGCQGGQFSALVTGPVHKGIINDAGIPFSGHTEFLAATTHTPHVVMMLATEGLRVALVTTHLPLSAVAETITAKLLEDTLRILEQDLHQRLGIKQPRILVCGLNPHAGEGGHLGHEELDFIEPVIQKLCQTEQFNLLGPVPADTAFTPGRMKEADVILTMYHDQGLPVLKHLGFGRAVNITLGLPFLRTSVDHGTALELAGSGQADTGSLEAAFGMAVQATHPLV